MRNLLSVAATAVLFAAIPVAANADTATLNAAGDTYVRSDLPTTNFESSSPDPLHVDGSPVRRTLLYFKNVPAAGVTAAKLRVHVRFHTGEPFEVHASTCQGWSETSVTYNTAPPAGELLATYTDDPLGYQEVSIPADKVVPSAEGGFCLQLTKSGVNWMTLSSRESANPPQLVLDTTVAPPPPAAACGDGVDNDGDGRIDYPTDPGCTSATDTDETDPVVPPPTSPVSTCSDAPSVNATPSNMASVLANNNRVRINASPGSYSSLSVSKSTSNSCIVVKCTVSAKSGSFGANLSGCILNNQSTFQNVKDLTVEGFVIRETGDGSYGFQHYDERNVGSNTRFANNVFDDSTDHDISTKNRGRYFEVLDNWFLHCRRHCWEIGQNGNIRTRPSTTGTSVFRGNIVNSTINGLTQRYNVNLIVEDNEFRNAGGYAINSWPYWTFYPFGSSGDNGALYVPGSGPSEGGQIVPLRTTIRNNTFSGNAALRFTGRGVIDDKVLLQGNTGITSCVRGTMDSQNTGTSAAHINEQTTAPPQLDPASDRTC